MLTFPIFTELRTVINRDEVHAERGLARREFA